jgi:hypothetical protein
MFLADVVRFAIQVDNLPNPYQETNTLGSNDISKSGCKGRASARGFFKSTDAAPTQ